MSSASIRSDSRSMTPADEHEEDDELDDLNSINNESFNGDPSVASQNGTLEETAAAETIQRNFRGFKG
jgi:hypothetical protein